MTLKAKPPKPKPCRVCRETFTPRAMSHVACSVDCAKAVAAQKRETEQRKSEEAMRANRDRLRLVSQAVKRIA